MNECEKYAELASRYLDGELAGGEAAELERHLAGCAACRATLEEFRQADATAREISEPSGAEWAGVWERIEAQAERQVVVRIIQARIWKRAAWAAAAAALLLGIYVFAPRGGQLPATAGFSFEVVSLEVDSPNYTPVMMPGNHDQLPVVWLERI
jgi:anti-sigma factor RsiW